MVAKDAFYPFIEIFGETTNLSDKLLHLCDAILRSLHGSTVCSLDISLMDSKTPAVDGFFSATLGTN